ncbi:MAG: chemotaxis protein CheD [Gammaproteobacteria bacterium]|nr:chemotaxis protein CheD [Gammaproteobacteria bacterium]
MSAQRDLFLLPGGLHVGGAEVRVHTLLGSCVAVTLWSRRHRLGGICHYLLPSHELSGRGAQPLVDHPPGHYGTQALAWLLEQLGQRGVIAAELEAKIIGGGALFEQPGAGGGVGMQNSALARHFLYTAGVVVVAEDVGRRGYRRLVFDMGDGAVWVRYNDITPQVAV